MRDRAISYGKIVNAVATEIRTSEEKFIAIIAT